MSVASDKLAVGDTETVTVKLTAGDADLTGVELDKGLVVPADKLAVVKSPAALGGFSLASGASRSSPSR